jgi:hypothetical protein
MWVLITTKFEEKDEFTNKNPKIRKSNDKPGNQFLQLLDNLQPKYA